MFNNLTTQQKGIALIVGGIILLLFALGVLKQLFTYVIILGSLFMIGYGLYMSGYLNQLMRLINKKK